MHEQNKPISWDEHLPKYKIPTVLKETLLKPYFESLTLQEPIIDLGCGTGYFADIITKSGKTVLGVDKHGHLNNSDLFTFQKQDILGFQSEIHFKTVLMINILSVEVPIGRKKIISKVSQLLDHDGIAYILTTNSKLFISPTNSDLISFEKISEDQVHLRVQLTNGEYIEFDDYIVSEDETRGQILECNLEIIEEKEFQHPEMDRPVYILYVVKNK